MLQVVSNLITNALDALSPKGVLCLRLRKRRGEVQFLIADSGHGSRRSSVTASSSHFLRRRKNLGQDLG
jgi:sensor histidine kinase regulating citrate/malate metabolism